MKMMHYHFIGIGGIGLSAIAKILLEQGHFVTGSDLQLNHQTAELQKLGAVIYHGHNAKNLDKRTDVVIVSSAIDENNPEIIEAKKQKIQVLKRNDFLSMFSKEFQVIGIAGTHGKTTTTAMTVHLLKTANISTTFIVGGILKNYHTNGGFGKSKILVIEADEFDYAFLGLNPYIALITNIEFDHPDMFKNPSIYFQAFQKYVNQIVSNGYLIINGNDKYSNQLKTNSVKISFGDKSNCDYQLKYYQSEIESSVDIVCKSNICKTKTKMFGYHNAINWTSVKAIADILKIPNNVFTEAVKTFKGVERRMELISEKNGITYYSDYAHHPTEVEAVLNGVKALGKKVIAVYQPHQFSRTKALLKDYKDVFKNADKVVLLPIFKSRDKSEFGLNLDDLAKTIKHKKIHICPTLDQMPEFISKLAKSGDVVVLMTAGDADAVLREYLKKIRRNYIISLLLN